MGASLGSVLLAKPAMRMEIGARSLILRSRMGERDRREPEEPSPERICAAAQALLQAHPGQAMDVRLACSWSRMLLLAWTEQLTSQERWLNYARARFEEVFGENSDAWSIAVARDLPGRDRLAVAWPVQLHDFFVRQRKVRSLRVGLLEHLGALLAFQPAFTGCIIDIDADGAGFLLLVAGSLRRVRWCRFDNADGLATAVHAEWENVLSARDAGARVQPSLALTPPAPREGSAREQAVNELGIRLGISEGFSLPDWP